MTLFTSHGCAGLRPWPALGECRARSRPRLQAHRCAREPPPAQLPTRVAWRRLCARPPLAAPASLPRADAPALAAAGWAGGGCPPRARQMAAAAHRARAPGAHRPAALPHPLQARPTRGCLGSRAARARPHCLRKPRHARLTAGRIATACMYRTGAPLKRCTTTMCVLADTF